MNLIPIAQKLQDAGLGVMGTSIFINMIPAESPTGILLRNKLQGTKIDYELPGFYKAKFQLIVRANAYTVGESLINRVCEALTLDEQQVGPLYVRYMRPETMPVVFPLSNGNLLEFAVNFDIVFNQ